MENDFNQKNRKEAFVTNVVTVCFTGIIIILLFLMFTSCASLTPAERYANEHSYRSFEYAMNNNNQFTLSSAKDDLREAKKDNKKAEKLESDLAKVDAITKKIQELKKNNQ